MSLFKLTGGANRPKKLLIQPSAKSPFCTSPSQLQEVTLDPDATNFSYMEMRSPGALSSGRSVKEIDEQLTNLKKENFNLKLRIYFLEERMGANFSTDKEDAIKKNIELMVELENIRKELEDKQELLCQAAKAMEIEEEEKKKELEARDQEINELKNTLEKTRLQLENEQEEIKQIALCTEAFDLSDSSEIIMRLQNKIEDLENELKKERERANHFENIMEIAECVREKCKNLETLLQEKETEMTNLKYKLEEKTCEITNCDKHINEMKEELVKKSTQLENSISNSIQKDYEIKEHQVQLKEFKKLYEATLQQRDKFEKKSDKYKSLLVQSESKKNELLAYIDSIKSKMQVRGHKLNIEECKASEGLDIIASTEQISKSNNPDVELFSVPVFPAAPKSFFPKVISEVNSHSKSTSPSLSPKSSSPLQSSDLKNNSEELQLSNEELQSLKHNHFKACQIIKTMIKKKKDYMDEIDKLQMLVDERGEEIEVLQTKIKELMKTNVSGKQQKKSIKEKVSELNLTATSNPTANKENSVAEDEMNLAKQYKELTNELENKIELLNATIIEKDSQIEKCKTEIQDKANQIIDLEFEILAITQGINTSKEDISEKQIYEEQEKERQIQKLENELRQRTCDLQGIVNKELWEKNRTIEKMQTLLKSKDGEINNLEKDVHGKEMQLKILKDKINELGIHVNLPPSLIITDSNFYVSDETRTPEQQLKVYLEERKHFIREIEELKSKIKNMPERDEKKYHDLCIELEKSENLRHESQEVCAILSTRLEELCSFLDSLLKQKSVLGFLGNEQTHKLQQALNRSLELSRTLSNSISLNPDQSLLQLTDITNLLDLTRNDNFSNFFFEDEENNSMLSIIPSDVTLTYRSHLNIACPSNNEQTEVIKVLRQQVDNLKQEIAVRDVELSKKQTSEEYADLNLKLNKSLIKNKNIEVHSESESWSEPDRTVSLARIGLHDESLKKPSNVSLSRRAWLAGDSQRTTESTEEEESMFCSSKTPSKRTTLSESRQTIISLHEQVCDLEVKLKEKDNQLLATQVAYYETDNTLKREQVLMEELKQENGRLSSELYNAEQLAKTLESEHQQLLAQIRQSNEDLGNAKVLKYESEQKIAELQNIVVTLEEFKQNVEETNEIKFKQMQNTLNEMEIEKSKAIESVKNMEIILEQAKTDIQTAEAELKAMYTREENLRKEMEENLKSIEERYTEKLKSIAQEHEIKKNTIIESYKKDYVERRELEKCVMQFEEISNEVEKLKDLIQEYNSKIILMEQNEAELKNKIIDMQREHHDKISGLHKELDNAALKYSEVLLEKSKLKNETTSFEQQIQKYHTKERELLKQINNYKIQILNLEQSLKINEQQSSMLSTSLPNNPGTLSSYLGKSSLPIPIFKRQFSDHSGYTSEEIGFEDGDSKNIVGQVQNLIESLDVDHERIQANSSPDLGIESDHGRFSSLETNINNIPRPLLPSLELAQSMNSLLDPIHDAACGNEQCCKKTKEITNENVDLRKRLLRTRRALEDTLTRLTLANKQKKEVEKSICRQIHKTSQVLRKAKANLDSGSETDIIKK